MKSNKQGQDTFSIDKKRHTSYKNHCPTKFCLFDISAKQNPMQSKIKHSFMNHKL